MLLRSTYVPINKILIITVSSVQGATVTPLEAIAALTRSAARRGAAVTATLSVPVAATTLSVPVATATRLATTVAATLLATVATTTLLATIVTTTS